MLFGLNWLRDFFEIASYSPPEYFRTNLDHTQDSDKSLMFLH